MTTIDRNLQALVLDAFESIFGKRPSERQIQIQTTKVEFEGDRTLVVFPLAGMAGGPPHVVAESLGQALQNQADWIVSYNVVKGFLNLTLSPACFASALEEALKHPHWGHQPQASKPQIMVEFSSPNTNKPLHLGHLRNNFLGFSVSKILEAAGHDVVKVQRSNRLFIDSSGNSKVLGEYFYPGDEWKGDVARIIMYMYLRYPSQCEPVNSATGPVTYAANNDMPDIFLEWNDQDPVSDLEITRNDVISSYQGNRNPFIDNPYLATMIWGGPDAEDTWGVLSLETPKQNDFEIQLNVSHGLVEVNGLNSEPYTITVFNMLGQEILQQKNSKTIGVSSLGKGIYILKVEQSGQQAALKFSVQK